jgi:hypothetical protein
VQSPAGLPKIFLIGATFIEKVITKGSLRHTWTFILPLLNEFVKQGKNAEFG